MTENINIIKKRISFIVFFIYLSSKSIVRSRRATKSMIEQLPKWTDWFKELQFY